MKSLIILHHLSVKNANAIAGLTYGFPAISNFLGFTHALSRTLQKDHGLVLGGCAVICHQHAVQAYQPAGWGDYVFALTRNPLTKEAKTAAFNEEARMSMDVSLLIECDFTSYDFDFDTGSTKGDIAWLEQYLTQKVLMQRLAGGTIQSIKQVQFAEIPQDIEKRDQFNRKQLLRLLPGFALVNRPDVLQAHHQALQASNPDADLIDAWLDFSALKYQAISTEDNPNEESKASWQRIPKPASGYLVPISMGYHAISPLYAQGEVASARDANTPFRFVESAYSIGQWISPHRIHEIESLIWRYQCTDEAYLCKNLYQPAKSTQ
ncbi:type I-F CRISPR-associated protein Csy2 [Iodobacter sp. HSC-16F04]|uniref:Type I-F CRISPR-associated protein Csy2 n=1 Tax=Iodobacter violaceini TaxID=3044271 RepID=A0ABX0L5D3_9NEIS|nr:type I-F CRISPR-associated protein Csy2 [Iodobacter violacea]NHQ87828.1 type I-F CRISPR-associated protein Csy2 [Iodobacter violacea]